MRLFQRIFAIFCIVIVCAMMIASFAFWVVQEQFNENHYKQQRNIEVSLLINALTIFQNQGEIATRHLFETWKNNPAASNIMIITGENKKDLLGREISDEEIDHAYEFALKNPNSQYASIYYDPFGQEYLFFIKNFDKPFKKYIPALIIPGIPLSPVWHEFIIFAVILIVGLLVAYLIASNISKPIRILESGMNRLAAGELDTRVSQQLDDRKDELAVLGQQFDKMATQLQILVEKERHLLHHVSHEMRSPLARIQAVLGLLQTRPDKQSEYITRLETELTRMDTLVDELLTLSRLETSGIKMDKEPLSIPKLLQQLVEDNQEIAIKNRQKLTLEINNIDEKCRFDANERYLYRAFDNVIRNAINYSPEGSTIQIKAYEDKKSLNIHIIDNGPGIKEEQLPHIFNAFYRADSSAHKPGTGLGLAIAKHVTEQHNGKIKACNQKPNGLDMHFIFPKGYKAKEI